jgi:hypothetical protein
MCSSLGSYSIFLLVSLESFERKPDCFRRAARYMRARCADLELDEDQRVRGGDLFPIFFILTADYD